MCALLKGVTLGPFLGILQRSEELKFPRIKSRKWKMKFSLVSIITLLVASKTHSLKLAYPQKGTWHKTQGCCTGSREQLGLSTRLESGFKAAREEKLSLHPSPLFLCLFYPFLCDTASVFLSTTWKIMLPTLSIHFCSPIHCLSSL